MLEYIVLWKIIALAIIVLCAFCMMLMIFLDYRLKLIRCWVCQEDFDRFMEPTIKKEKLREELLISKKQLKQEKWYL